MVDDNATNRQIIEQQARRWGMRVSAAASGAQALQILPQGGPFDLAVLDVQMPEMDGVTLAGEIRKIFSPEQLPIIFLTSLGSRAEIPETIKPAAFLFKPIKLSSLYDNLISALILTAEEEVDAPTAEETEKERSRQFASEYPLHILLAEDNPVNQRVAARLLEKMGFRADTVGNGKEALQAVMRQKYDVVLMDIQMPEMDGEEAVRLIRARTPVDRQPHIIAMTANALEGDRERYLASGMNDYISKPVTLEQLKHSLQKVILRRELTSSHRSKKMPANVENAPARPSSIDTAALRANLPEGEPDLLAELINLLKQETPKHLQAIREAIRQGDGEQLRKSAHTLKGSALTVGAVQLAELCKQMEARGKEGRLNGAEAGIASLEEEYQRVIGELDGLVGEG